MAGLVPAIHVLRAMRRAAAAEPGVSCPSRLAHPAKAWMPGPSPGMTAVGSPPPRRAPDRKACSLRVMAGLVPAIHVLRAIRRAAAAEPAHHPLPANSHGQ